VTAFDPSEYECLVTAELRVFYEYLGKRTVTAKHEELKDL